MRILFVATIVLGTAIGSSPGLATPGPAAACGAPASGPTSTVPTIPQLLRLAADGSTTRPQSDNRGRSQRPGFCRGGYLRCANRCWSAMRRCTRQAHRRGGVTVQGCHKWLQGCYRRCHAACDGRGRRAQ